MSEQTSPDDRKPSFGIRSGQDFGAGLFLIALGIFAFWQAQTLGRGTLNAMGAGMLPQSLAVMVAVGGLGLVITSLLVDGPRLERWSLRGAFFIFGGIVLFALTIRPLGLVVSGPLAMFFGSMASDEFRWKESAIFAVILTTICILLFKVLLRLPIPVVGSLLEPILPF
ncbi:MAG: tripartite tricarboxylate transporter TctB family protein [Beijerinckiaceae bacterium]|jgi:hypothetical protein|nr:tripartite tricarboxylate transporter TctB family protein [Beijerinckiaceae bacterium]MDO9440208.1 tripartite tricarboxylate transporter TctB family protein [Beijerinckiaceae bacterium]